MCCHGCQAVAQAIVNGGMQNFYKYRTEAPARPEEVVPEFLQQLKAYDNPVVQQHFVSAQGEIHEVSLILEGIVCAACIWLNEQQLHALPGIIDVSINYSNHRARLRWDSSVLELSQILEAISRIGYMAHPYDPDQQQALIEKERKQHIRRIGVAAVLGMQVMILAVAMYTGEWWGMDAGFMDFFRWTSLLVTVPILIFSAQPFYRSAWRDIKNFHVGMDVPVALGISIAFVASVTHTLSGHGAVYFDSVAMFTFFLLSARYFEMNARKRTAESTEALLNLQPAVATKLVTENETQQHISVPVAELIIGDTILIKPGENIAADGSVIEGQSGVNESLVTGESMPVTKHIGDSVIGGSTNIESPLIIRVDKVGDDTVLASIHRLLDDAQTHKPEVARLADIIASRFVAVILLIATLVAIYWYNTEPEQWIAITIATLVVTCPCALSLATPTAITAASGQFARLGLLPLRSHALETLAKVSDFVFDKTGTLTEGNIKLINTLNLGGKNTQHIIAIAAALESGSEHPIAKSIITAAGETAVHADKLSNTAGAGVSGTIDNERWYLGNLDYIKQNCDDTATQTINTDTNTAQVVLATKKQLHAVFELEDSVREEAAELISKLKQQGKTIHLITGDQSSVAKKIAATLGIDHVYANMRPEDKLKRVREIQQGGGVVAMAGDGINDAPVLAGADVSIAMGSGTQLAAASADMILISNHVLYLYTGYKVAQKTLHIIRQNLLWAIGYNVIAVPAAAMGYVEPWLAAIGMSASSLIVVLNALRLTRLNV